MSEIELEATISGKNCQTPLFVNGTVNKQFVLYSGKHQL